MPVREVGPCDDREGTRTGGLAARLGPGPERVRGPARRQLPLRRRARWRPGPPPALRRPLHGRQPARAGAGRRGRAPQDTVAPASRTPAVLAGILRSALESGELIPPRRTLPGGLLRPEARELFGGTPAAPFSDIVERGIVLWSSLIGLLVFQVFSRTHDSVRDEAAYFDHAVAVAAETVGLVVPLGEDDH
ncbi:WHG domain-containing protein [Streptomyces yangpuensis]|uniref:WHG domain-containing protein n=1 Tax=Streptomyces yangpuensis TaxID=1648182 RepID=UPI00365D22DB